MIKLTMQQYGGKTKQNHYTVLNNAHINVVNSDIIVGRHMFNKNGNSWMSLHYDIKNMNAFTVPNKKNKLCFHAHYSCGFGHALHAILYSYYCYLTYYKPLININDCLILNFNGDRHKHLKEINELIAEVEGITIKTFNNKQNINCQSLTLFEPIYYPHKFCYEMGQLLRNKVCTKDSKLPKVIALVKTTDSRKIDNSYNPRGNFNANKIKKIFNELNITMIPHHNLNIKQILQYMHNCDVFITNWGATSAYYNFLRPDQKCLVIKPNTYGHEQENICFNRSVFSNLVISNVVRNNLTLQDMNYLRAWLKNNIIR